MREDRFLFVLIFMRKCVAKKLLLSLRLDRAEKIYYASSSKETEEGLTMSQSNFLSQKAKGL